MAENSNREGYEFNTNKGTRMDSAAKAEEGKDQRAAGGKYKGQKSKRTESNHQEGMYDKQNDDATMHPSSDDDL